MKNGVIAWSRSEYTFHRGQLSFSDLGPTRFTGISKPDTYTSKINYRSGAFSSGTDVTELLKDPPDLFGFDVTITGIVISSFDGNVNTRPLDTTNAGCTAAYHHGWGINGGTRDRQLFVDDDEGLLITFDSFVEISEIEFSGVGIQES
ncbi:MAG: hypothetical protein AAGB06_04115 [Verrucomicrobiota bacterium]